MTLEYTKENIKGHNKSLKAYGFKDPVRDGEKMAEFRKVENKIFKFENEGDLLEGTLRAVKDSENFNNKEYTIETTDGETVKVFGTSVLDDLMQSVKVDQEIRIVFTGEKENKKKGQNNIKLFDVFVK